MAEHEQHVALYIDFDNVVISRASQVQDTGGSEMVAMDVLLDFAKRYGRLTVARAYADWSVKKNASYKHQLVERAVELVQLFPATKTKNGADIRLAVDAIEDMYLLDDLTHVVIVAGDSDFVSLAQRVRRLGRMVLGIGVAGSISKTLAGACDIYAEYDELLENRHKDEEVDRQKSPLGPSTAPASASSTPRQTTTSTSVTDTPRRAYPLLVEAMQGLSTQKPEAEWHALSALKNQVLKIYPTFKESDYDATSFSKLLTIYASQIEVKDNRARMR